MAYGLRLYNINGEQILDLDNKIYHLKSTGTTISATTEIASFSSAVSTAGWNTNFYRWNFLASGTGFFEGNSPNTATQYVLGGATGAYLLSGTADKAGRDLDLIVEETDLVFFKVSDTIKLAAQANFRFHSDLTDIPFTGFLPVASESSGAALDYKIVGCNNLGTPVGDTGMIISDSTGTKIFDSRHEPVAIQAFQLDKELCASILDNGFYVDFPLGDSYASCYICCPFLTAFNQYTTGGILSLEIFQPNSTTLRVQRKSPTTGPSGFIKGFAQDIIILVTR